MITDISRLQKDLPIIYNIDNFLVTPEKCHPDTPQYIKQWNNYRRHSIEGIWVYDVHGWRFMPATLFKYGNFFKIEDQDGKQRIYRKPDIRDVDWLIHYGFLTCLGFSGFADDNLFSSDTCLINEFEYNLIKGSSKDVDQQRYVNLFNNKGKRKQYVEPREYLTRLHKEPLGKCLYYNQASNLMIFGSRGGGKSYTIAGIIDQQLTFDGMKEYTQAALDRKPKINISVGAAITDKSSELLDKVVKNLEFQGTDPDFGAWGTPGQPDYIPGPFYVDWVGSIKPNNGSNPFRYEYEVETPSGWQTLGSGTKLVHVNYSDKKQAGSQAAAGSRNGLNVYTEIGLMPNFRDALLSNEATVAKDQERFGVQLADGTSGNIDLVQQTKAVFNDPDQYSFLAYDNIWEDGSKIGLFLPAYLTNGKFKDRNGNTDIEKALKFFTERRLEAGKKEDVEILKNEKMNYPIVPSDMWVTSKSSYFPVSELLAQQKKIITDKSYKTDAKLVEFEFDSLAKRGVKSKLVTQVEPFYEFPFDRQMSSQEGAFMIWEEPQEIDYEIKHDQYLSTLDPYVSENIDEGGSIMAFHIWLNPKYLSKTSHKGLLMASFYGKSSSGKDAMYSVIAKAIQYYGNCSRSLWYEANRGESVRGFFVKKNKSEILALRPQREKGSHATERRLAEYGFVVGNNIGKLNMVTDASELLLKQFLFDGNLLHFFETIKDNFLLDQLIQFTFEGNFDAVSSYLGYALALKEIEHLYVAEQKKAERKNSLSFIALNPNIFHVDKSHRFGKN